MSLDLCAEAVGEAAREIARRLREDSTGDEELRRAGARVIENLVSMMEVQHVAITDLKALLDRSFTQVETMLGRRT